MSDWPYKKFSKEEMQCKCGCGGLPRPELMEKLQDLRSLLGFPLVVTSGYRCAKHNEEVSASGKDGPHVRGLAVDIKVSGVDAYRVLRMALDLGFTGIGVKQKTPFTKFLHLDIVPAGDKAIPRPAVWSY